MTTLSPSPLVVSLIQAATSMPIFLLALPAGALADVIDRRRLLLFSQGWMLLAAAALGLLTLEGMATPLAVLALSFALGVGAALNAPAWQAIVPELVGRDELTAAIRAQRDKLQSRARGRARARRPDCEPDGSGRYLLAQRGVVSGCDGGALPMAA